MFPPRLTPASSRRYIDGESLSPYKISPLDLHLERMFDPIVSRHSNPIIAPGSGVSSFISTFHEAGGHVILGQASRWSGGNDSEEAGSNEALLLMDQKRDKTQASPVLAPIWIP